MDKRREAAAARVRTGAVQRRSKRHTHHVLIAGPLEQCQDRLRMAVRRDDRPEERPEDRFLLVAPQSSKVVQDARMGDCPRKLRGIAANVGQHRWGQLGTLDGSESRERLLQELQTTKRALEQALDQHTHLGRAAHRRLLEYALDALGPHGAERLYVDGGRRRRRWRRSGHIDVAHGG